MDSNNQKSTIDEEMRRYFNDEEYEKSQRNGIDSFYSQREVSAYREAAGNLGSMTPDDYREFMDEQGRAYAEAHGIDWRANAKRLREVLTSEKMQILQRLAARPDFNDVIREMRNMRKAGTTQVMCNEFDIAKKVVGEAELTKRMQRYGIKDTNMSSLSKILSVAEMEEIRKFSPKSRSKSLVEQIMDARELK